jgi:hypothetical protein
MKHQEITAAVIAEIDRLLADGVDHATIARRFGLSTYVLAIIANEHGNVLLSHPIYRTGKHVHNAQKHVDAVTRRMIERMLIVGILRPNEIAREAGVSENTVRLIAKGENLISDTAAFYLQEGERFLHEPIRCDVCRALISVVPCRACNTRNAKISEKNV